MCSVVIVGSKLFFCASVEQSSIQITILSAHSVHCHSEHLCCNSQPPYKDETWLPATHDDNKSRSLQTYMNYFLLVGISLSPALTSRLTAPIPVQAAHCTGVNGTV
ncbi:hypothetical protein ABBQ32_010239 [Trebouxia sp. C0010 RCD-2024]